MISAPVVVGIIGAALSVLAYGFGFVHGSYNISKVPAAPVPEPQVSDVPSIELEDTAVHSRRALSNPPPKPRTSGPLGRDS